MNARSPHRYTHPATAPSTREELHVADPPRFPGVAVEDHTAAAGILADYRLALGQEVEVEVTGGHNYPRLVEGTVVDATRAVLVVDHAGAKVTTRIPWAAAGLIRDRATTTHPGLT